MRTDIDRAAEDWIARFWLVSPDQEALLDRTKRCQGKAAEGVTAYGSTPGWHLKLHAPELFEQLKHVVAEEILNGRLPWEMDAHGYRTCNRT